MQNRIYKFRAWDKEKKVMYSPSSISWDKDGKTLWVCDIHGTNTLEYELINPISELMQYTGLKDKNGVEIYEGDIVKGDKSGIDKNIYIVEYDEDQARFYFKQGLYHEPHFCEVIGNIYEHPNLLSNDK